jgi:ComF family protein
LWYEACVPTAIQWFKYEGEFARAAALAAYLEAELRSFEGIDALVPVPLHPRRQQRRGYNQSLALALALHRKTGIAVEQPLLRIRNTQRQVGLHGSERAVNVAGAIALKPDVRVHGRRMLMLDDVVTTGATMGECARVLRASGAEWVGGLAIARER